MLLGCYAHPIGRCVMVGNGRRIMVGVSWLVGVMVGKCVIVGVS